MCSSLLAILILVIFAVQAFSHFGKLLSFNLTTVEKSSAPLFVVDADFMDVKIQVYQADKNGAAFCEEYQKLSE